VLTARRVIELLGLEPLPLEGGHFRRSWRSSDSIDAGALPPRYASSKALGTAIYYLLTDAADSFSALHRLPTDEVYHFYLGDPVEMLLLRPEGSSERVVLGPDLEAGQQVQFVVPAGVWQGARLETGGRFALLGTTMAPGFDERDYEAGAKAALIERYPESAEQIAGLTRA
jgi:predicted cupin superfamily sugar epimerase